MKSSSAYEQSILQSRMPLKREGFSYWMFMDRRVLVEMSSFTNCDLEGDFEKEKNQSANRKSLIRDTGI